ncbi:MAG: phosphotransferase [Pseudomonadales bacterium]|nr:phosphotransferase [Pseudomonadales bacterium]
MTPTIISNPDNITTEWLTSVLRYAGQEARVTDFDAVSIGTGQVGENVRFTLQGDNVPESIVGKFPSRDPQSKQTGIDQGNYLREVFFYKEIQSTVDIQTPNVFFTDADDETHDFVIMMEDLAPGVQGDQLAGCSVDDAALALEELAKLQGPRWGDPTLQKYPLLVGTSQNPEMLQAFYKMLEPGFIERYESRLTGEYQKLVTTVGDGLVSYGNLYDGPPGLIHIDYRLDNMMFGGPYPLTVVDWQSLSTGCPVADASYFMGTSLTPEARAKEEEHLVRHYLDVLKSYDVSLKFDDAFRYYRAHAPAGLIMAVIASMIVGETERGNDMFMAMATRSSQMCLDLDFRHA